MIAVRGKKRSRALLPSGVPAFLLACAIVLALAGGLWAADDFPALSGRVVDDAGVLPGPTRAALEAKLKGLEDKSGIQLVVATVRSLGGDEIEPYANRLFRFWKLGEAKKNNGALLLVAPKEHKVRIEVGYGLEGTLTDALSKTIITNALAPRFKAGDFEGGVEGGVDDIIAVLSTDSAEWQKRPDLRPAPQDSGGGGVMIFLIVLGVIVVFSYFGRNRRSGLAQRGGGIVVVPTPSSWGEGSGGGSSGDSGFSGGGGSSGGGGASGDW